ncbi:C4-dicarboxylate ABC transporter permease [Solemya velum gill symbiont]|uniref:TRAP transporter large permease n=1 Tax=Solemya velum gill symbiont TaxID=2340 RepID=UPI00099738A1|nr:TRAP transporter large permease [Solemya velum gill symbiont]OOY39411.1 C4-dicarboxylate ABC transporter permease [Solemya velum gill symbiont]
MDSVSIGLWVTGFMLFFVIIGMRVAFAAAIAGFIGLVWIFSAKMGFERGVVVAMKMAGTIPHSKVSTLALSLIPTFILIGFLAYHAGLTRALFEAAKRWVGWLPGGMGVATVFSAAGFAAVSGASVATSAVFARIAIPEMLQLGYDKRFAAGVVAASGTLASLIPPSAILVIYAIIVEQDVGALLMAGFLPGMVSALIYGGLVVFLAKTKKDFGPPVTGYSWKQRFESLPGTLPIFFVVGIIVVCIYGGVGTPTEAGSLGAFVILCMALWKGMTGGELKSALLETAKLTVMIFTIIWGVLLYVRFLGFADLPSAFSDWITGLEQSPMITLILILLAYALLGMFAIWFGIIVVKMAELCLITPPIGLNCFVVAGVRDECSVQDVFHGVTPFFVADFLTIALLIALPQIVLWLPGLMGFS